MTGRPSSSDQFEELRRKAEENLEQSGKSSDKAPPVNVEEIKRLIHELQVHQAELEMQNNELQETQQKLQASEKQYAELYELAPISYVTLNKDGLIIDMNQTASENFGIPKNQLTGLKTFYELVDYEFRDRLYLFLGQVMQNPSSLQCELKLRLPSYSRSHCPNQPEESVFWALLDSKSYWEPEQDQLRCRVLISDITERKQLEAEQKEAKRKAEQNDALKSAFLANMSHEIRTPMNGIFGFAEFLRQPGLTDQERNQYLDIIYKSGQRLLNTVNDIVEISKVEAGISTVEATETHVNRKLQELVEFFRQKTDQKNLVLAIDEALPEASSAAMIDESKLESILTNLIKNAIKYTDEGAIRISCYVEQDGMLTFKVSDTGIGIPEHQQEAVFNRFERVFEGAGLGLALTKSYVTMLGGSWGFLQCTGKARLFMSAFRTTPLRNPRLLRLCLPRPHLKALTKNSRLRTVPSKSW